MHQNTFLYTLPQWFIFSGILVIVYGWVEQKKIFRMIGISILILLGIFAVYVITSGYFLSNYFFTPDEIMNQELGDEVAGEIPFQAQLLPAYWSFVVSSVLAIAALLFEWKDRKAGRILIVLSALVSLFGFFMIVRAIDAI